MKKKPPKPTGRPPHAPTDALRRTVEWAVQLGRNQDEIASIIGVTEKTLAKYYGAEIKNARIKTGIALLQTMTMKGLGVMKPGDPPDPALASERSALWLLERVHGLSPPVQRTRLSGAVGAYGAADLSMLTDTELEALDLIHDKIEAAAAGRDPGGNSAEDA